jgi:subtilase family serine protease
MRPRPIAICGLALAVISVSLISQRSLGQSNAARSLITAPIDESKLTVLRGNTHPLARAQYDQGPASASLPMDRMLLVLKSSSEQVAALQALLAQQTDKTSPNYHKWLSPQQFGERFGVSDGDLQRIITWLESHGFQSIKAANGRNVIEFSGTAGQVQNAFHTAIHNYMVNGQRHFANASDPSIPQALTPAVAGVLSLHNFGKKPMNRFVGMFRKDQATGKAEPISPQFTFAGGCFAATTNDCYVLGPTDFATIYNVSPLWNTGITGSGVKIAIVSDSNINISDVNQFRSLFGLPSNPPVVTVNGADPGVIPCADGGDECEAIIDVEWSGAVAKNATIDLVVSGSVTNSSFGGDLSAEYVIDNKFAPILSYSYGLCELGLGDAGNAFYGGSPTSKDSVGEWAQAAAEGITVIVATGDTGAAGCDNDATGVTTEQPAQFGLAVNGVASTPYNVAVGGTDFNQLGNPTTYWNSSNTSGTESSVIGYIPETAWNDSCTNAFLGIYFQGFSTDAEANCNNLSSSAFTERIAPAGGGGGASNCTSSDGQHASTCSGGYAKPSWQTGSLSDGKRDVPDVSLFAGDGFAGSFYVVCEEDENQPNSNTACSVNNFAGFGGTSVSTQVFAGMVALIDQKAQQSQGNLNTVLYPLAAQQAASSCNTSSPASSCVFYDVTIGTNAQPCVFGASPNCSRTNSADANGILTGYSAGTGFDGATGLGSINVANLVNSFAPLFALTSASPTVTVAAPGNSGTMTATVTAQGSFSGTVTFACTGLPAGASCSFNPPSATLSSTATTATTTLTVSTTAPSALAPTQRQQPAAPGPRNVAMVAALFCMLAVVIFALRTPNRRLRSATAFALLIFGMAGLMLMASCGGTSGGGGGGGGSGGTPTGSTNATITGTSGNATGTLNFTLDVQ